MGAALNRNRVRGSPEPPHDQPQRDQQRVISVCSVRYNICFAEQAAA